jgi:hypothetical protein
MDPDVVVREAEIEQALVELEKLGYVERMPAE